MWGYWPFTVKAIAIETEKMQRGPDGHSYRISAVIINQLKDAMEPKRPSNDAIESVFSIQVYNDPMASVDSSKFCVLNIVDGSRMLVGEKPETVRGLFNKALSSAYTSNFQI